MGQQTSRSRGAHQPVSNIIRVRVTHDGRRGGEKMSIVGSRGRGRGHLLKPLLVEPRSPGERATRGIEIEMADASTWRRKRKGAITDTSGEEETTALTA
ncbi:unnamed protein product [Vitrella brassicaformis CCMP3155]|uniref:Uncharacterized protein n=1 Tax=Vitrella brassicaformis (strain CCMP3155) TaxID=1169540 RepID=A0A0G4GYE7_VITBC|nr:unnamed protein product [Vitrella brassicaformis CCMP3155]|eukprot:CEM36168.1 unnamed protein product [Vitrella brassicaformis CCMP3155]